MSKVIKKQVQKYDHGTCDKMLLENGDIVLAHTGKISGVVTMKNFGKWRTNLDKKYVEWVMDQGFYEIELAEERGLL